VIKRYKLADGKLAETDAPDAEVTVCVAPDNGERRWLLGDLRIDEHTLNSALDPDELSRMETETDYLALIFKRPKNYSSADNFLFRVESTGLFWFKDRLVIIAREDYNMFEGRVFSKVTSLADLALKLLYASVSHFMGHLRVINEVSNELERLINRSMENRYLLNMFTLEKSLVYYLNAISANTNLIDRLKSNASRIGLGPDSLHFLDDLTIDNNQCYQHASTYSQVLSSLMDARASIVSNNLNVMMKNLNAIVIAVAVPSFFAGVGGMSEFSAVTGIKHWYIAYPLFVLFMLLIGGITFVFIKQWERRWR
jgi:magnesium transporter